MKSGEDAFSLRNINDGQQSLGRIHVAWTQLVAVTDHGIRLGAHQSIKEDRGATIAPMTERFLERAAAGKRRAHAS